MAWGYEKSFTIEHDDTVRKRLNCKDCFYYDKSDKPCTKRPLYLPADGYNSWKNCEYFEIDSSTSNYDTKWAQYENIKRTNKQNKKDSLAKVKKSKNQTKTKKNQINKTSVVMSDYKNNDLHPIDFKVMVIIGKYPPKLHFQYIDIILDTGKQIKVQVGFDLINKTAYIKSNVYTKEAIIKVIEKIG